MRVTPRRSPGGGVVEILPSPGAYVENTMEHIQSTYQGRPCCVAQMTIGNTAFTVISVQSDHASETACQKLKRLILDNASPQRILSTNSKTS